jgi:hypothetical protein
VQLPTTFREAFALAAFSHTAVALPRPAALNTEILRLNALMLVYGQYTSTAPFRRVPPAQTSHAAEFLRFAVQVLSIGGQLPTYNL